MTSIDFPREFALRPRGQSANAKTTNLITYACAAMPNTEHNQEGRQNKSLDNSKDIPLCNCTQAEQFYKECHADSAHGILFYEERIFERQKFSHGLRDKRRKI
jgi:hypothetical protein